MKAKQVKFEDADGVICGGILVNTGNESFIICQCCGAIWPMDKEGKEFKLIQVYDDWMCLSEENFKRVIAEF